MDIPLFHVALQLEQEGFKLFMSKVTEMPLSKEPALLYLVPFLALFVAGAGAFSFDAMIRRRRSGSVPPSSSS